MKPKTLMLLVVAGGCGLVAMMMVQQVMTGSQSQPRETASVLVALEDIESGMRLTADNVGFQDKPVDSIPEDAILSEEEYQERGAQVLVLTGEVIRLSKLTEKGGWGKSMSIPKGMRVITITANDTHTASGLLRPGDRVDVLVNYRGQNERGVGVSKTKTLLEYVEVFATDDRTETKLEKGNESGRAKNVSLLVLPDHVGYVMLAQQKGSLSLAWRNRLDDEVVAVKEIDEVLLEELSGAPSMNNGGFPLYEMQNKPFVDGDDVAFNRPPTQDIPDSPAEFLDSIAEPASQPEPLPISPSPIASIPSSGPTWSVQVFHGNSPQIQQFELKEAQPATASGPSLTDAIRSFWGGGSETTAPPEDSSQTEF